MNSQFFGYINKQAIIKTAPLDHTNICPLTTVVFANRDCSTVDSSQVHLADMTSAEKRIPRKSNKDMLQREDATIFDSCEETSRTRPSSTASSNISSKEAFIRHKVLIFIFFYLEHVIFLFNNM